MGETAIEIKGTPFSCSNWKGDMAPVKAPPVVTDEQMVRSSGRLSNSPPDSVAISVITASGPIIYSPIPLSIAGIATAMEARPRASS